ncbi:glutamate racemase [Candidatus Stoquefichus massiliensis]|uniref:glutamate racemase n=1 Tax=Candidatus Stoquefichus massiliensis TaxID=1470350 RepID=UPI00047F843A|nr:glutamate racemase [Candidatus Stoquefichus massiliensis]
MDKPIGIFDSGVGGLTVLDHLKMILPHENMIYIGDNIHCPYGEKTKEQLLKYTREICDFFISQNVKMIVLACNTTSANVLNELQQFYPQIPIVGVINSTVHDFLSRHLKRVLVIATHATIQSHKYKEIIHHYDQSIQVYELATPKLVPLVESGQYKEGIEDILKDYLKPYIHQVDSLILGCTHYPIILDQMKNVFYDKDYISSSEAICEEVSSYLLVHHLHCQSEQMGSIQIYTTGNPQEFRYSSEGFFDYQNLEIQYLDFKSEIL